MAPALTIGLRGMPVLGAGVMALNASPVGSTPMRWRTRSRPTASSAAAYVSGLDIDWMVKRVSASPTRRGRRRRWRSRWRTGRVDARELRDVGRDVAVGELLVAGAEALQEGHDRRHGRARVAAVDLRAGGDLHRTVADGDPDRGALGAQGRVGCGRLRDRTAARDGRDPCAWIVRGDHAPDRSGALGDGTRDGAGAGRWRSPRGAASPRLRRGAGARRRGAAARRA